MISLVQRVAGLALGWGEPRGPARPALAGAPRCVPGVASSARPVRPLPAATGDRSEGSLPATVVREGRHDVGFARHLSVVNDLEHAAARAREAEARTFEVEVLLERWLATHAGHFTPKGPDARLIPDTLRALGVAHPVWADQRWVDGDAT